MILENQKKAAQYLQKVLDSGKTPPALLLYGPAGAGKGYLAHSFAKQYLMLGLQQAGWPIGRQQAGQQIDSRRYPDLLLFSARDLAGQLAVTRGALQRLSLDGARRLALEMAGNLVHKLDPTLFNLKKIKTGKNGELAEQLYSLEQGLTVAGNSEELDPLLEQMEQLALAVPQDLLPVQGIRELIHRLAHRTVLGNRRAVIVEGIHHLRNEGANAFLKTLEEPSPGTVLILTADSLQGVLPTIKSRCALVPVPRVPAEQLRKLAAEYGASEPVVLEGVYGLWGYLKENSGAAEEVHRELVEFFDYVDEGENRPDLFDFLQKIIDNGHLRPFLTYLQQLILDRLTAGNTGYGEDKLLIHLLRNDDPWQLRRIEGEIRAGLEQLERVNYHPLALLQSVYMDFFLARSGVDSAGRRV